MKAFIRHIILYLSLAFLSACSGLSAVKTETVPPETVPPAEISPIISGQPGAGDIAEDGLPAGESVILRIKANREDIPKYIFTEEDGRFSVRADMEGYKIVYDLASSGGEMNAIPVGFTAEEKSTGLLLKDEFIWTPGQGDAGILLAFDDAYTKSWKDYFPLFERYNAKATFFIMGKFDPFCLEALERGHDVGYHGMNHLDLRKYPEEKITEEAVSPASIFRDEGVPLFSFAYPFGFFEPRIHTFLLEHYNLLRGYGTTFRVYDKAAINSGFIISRAIDNIVIKNEENFYFTSALMLKTVKFMGRDYVLPLTSHDISAGADWGITPERLEYILKTTAELKLNFYRYGDFKKE